MTNVQPRKPFLTTVQTVFLASMIAADFGFGMVVKNLLLPTHILDIIRLDMVIPITVLLLTRKLVDRFGILSLYEGIWGLFSVFAMPSAFGLPGFVKLIPAISQGIIMDSFMSLFKPFPKIRFLLTSILGGILSTTVYFGLKLALGMPWSTVVKVLFGVQMATNIVVWTISAVIAEVVWKRIKDTDAARRICFVPNR